MRQSIVISDIKLRNYFSEKKLMLTFCILQYGIKSIMARRDFLGNKINDFRNYSLMEFSPVDDLTEQISRRQIVHLDLLSSIFMFMEDFLGYSYNLRKPLHEFPKLIASRNDKTVKFEIDLLKKYKKKDINQFLLFTDVKLLPIDAGEKMIVNNHMKNIVDDTHKSIRSILRFYRKYYRLYIKYKHILSALLGFHRIYFDIHNKRQKISSQIYIRDYNRGFSTYMIPTTSMECVDYYQDIVEDIFNVFLTLMIAYLSHMINLGKPYIIPILPQEDSDNSGRLEQIISRINYLSWPFVPVNTEISFTKKLSKYIITNMQKEQIVRIRRDIFDYRQKQTS